MLNSNKIMNTTGIYDLLAQVPDPEVPAINIIELGIVRDVTETNGQIIITITPTYTGCPAMKVIEQDIAQLFTAQNITNYTIKTVLNPAWTTDWITKEGRDKLLAYGIAPPITTTANKKILLGDTPIIACPQCKSTNTTMVSQFGSTACKALWKCADCLEPFDYFKCL
ncbi:MAG: phenylacetate-CoA oxygenase subunit PaaJ [Bacteroidia bacterium]|nr:phenylacetate-CoA oxygenase subunit PaaJ [Bacteroidia bacterium]